MGAGSVVTILFSLKIELPVSLPKKKREKEIYICIYHMPERYWANETHRWRVKGSLYSALFSSFVLLLALLPQPIPRRSISLT